MCVHAPLHALGCMPHDVLLQLVHARILPLCVLLQHALCMLLGSGQAVLCVAVVQAGVPHEAAVLPGLQLVEQELHCGQLRGGDGATALHDGGSKEWDIGAWFYLFDGNAVGRVGVCAGGVRLYRWVVTLPPDPGRPSPCGRQHSCHQVGDSIACLEAKNQYGLLWIERDVHGDG